MSIVLQDDCVLIMWQCRKIYCNLLLLSVILFTLGTTTRPVRCCADISAVTSWDAPLQQNVKFNWDNRSGSIVYRGQQLMAVTDDEFYTLLPSSADHLTTVTVRAVWHRLNLNPVTAGELLPATSRAPPVSLDIA